MTMTDADRTMAERIEALADAGLLTERQAEVYIRRVIELEPRWAVAEAMGVSENVHDTHLRAARDKVEAAEDTLDELENQRFEALPRTCAECGATLGGRYAEDDDGDALCLDCAGLDTAEQGEDSGT